MSVYTKRFEEITLADLPQVGGKNSSLGEMFCKLKTGGISVPDGFATTAEAFWTFLTQNNLVQPLQALMASLNRQSFSNLKEVGAKARALLLNAEIPAGIASEIIQEYGHLCGDNLFAVAVRSSATAEDLPQASFAGLHDSFLYIIGEKELRAAV
jgi:pyruvate, water dikinase